MAEKTHWKKKFNYEYLGSYSLADGKDVTLTIQVVKDDSVTGGDGKKQVCPVAYFKEKADWIKPMILNRTNCKIIEKIYGTPFTEDWAGKQITIYISNGVKAFGDVVDALRIRTKKPEKPTLNNQHKAWQTCVDYVKSGKPIVNITDKYNMDQTTFDILESCIPKQETTNE